MPPSSKCPTAKELYTPSPPFPVHNYRQWPTQPCDRKAYYFPAGITDPATLDGTTVCCGYDCNSTRYFQTGYDKPNCHRSWHNNTQWVPESQCRMFQ